MNERMATATNLTVSAREILKYYNEQIVDLRAKGGFCGANKVVIDSDYGISVVTPGSTYLEFIYRQKRDTEGNTLNILSEGKVKEIYDIFDSCLNAYYDEREDVEYPPDLAVESFEIETKRDDTIQKLAGTDTDIFDMRFVSDIIESDELKDKIKKKNKNFGLFKFQGFKIRALSMHCLIETAEKYGERKKYVQEWNGIYDTHPKSPIKLAQHVVANYLPKKYAWLSFLNVKETNRVVLGPMEEEK